MRCWSFRRGCMHAVLALGSSLRCAHLQSQGSSVCIPLIANGETIGVLSIQDDEQQSDASLSSNSDAFARRNCKLNAPSSQSFQAARSALTYSAASSADP